MNEDPASSIDTLPPVDGAGGVSGSAGGLDLEIRLADEGWRTTGLDPEQIATRAVTAALAAVARRGDLPKTPARIEIGVSFTDDQEMRRLNSEYRQIDRPTNVLAFPTCASLEDLAGEAKRATAGGALGLGDVVLARQTVCREAEAAGRPLADHLAHLIAHGVLHLLGFDHDQEDKAEAMEALEIEILRSLGMANPYDETGTNENG